MAASFCCFIVQPNASKAATGVWTIVEHHTILMVAIFKYLNIWKYFIFNAKHNSVFPSIFWIFLCKRFFLKI